jgi:Asp-tRNA(Asn)/Glu-tRNA(Gln) amidotransferase B subunit
MKPDGTIYYNGGRIGVGTDSPLSKFAVDGEIRATKVRVKGNINLPDYVFEEDYDLRSIETLDAYIKQHKHLPDVPSAQEVEVAGLSLGDMDAVLLKKIEELTLYIIELKKEIEQIKSTQNNKK